MRNRSTAKLAIALILLAKAPVSLATIGTEPIQTAPVSTQDLWEYSYFAPDGDITSSSYYASNVSEYSEVVHQGYLTGVGTRPNRDHFSDVALNSQAMRVFDTCIMSSIDQTVRFATGGDDGHSIFIDDSFLTGGGFGVNVVANVDMTAGQIYKLTSVSSNYGGGFEVWLSIAGDLEQGVYGWSGSVSEAQDISMDAACVFPAAPPVVPTAKPVPVMGIWGIGILSGMISLLGMYHRRRR